MSDRRDLCVDILSEGFVDSYIELFYLLHRYNESGELQPCQLSEDELIFLKENLKMAQVSQRKSDLLKRHAAYKNIGDYFKNNKEFESAIYFFNKCHDLIADDDGNDNEQQSLQLITFLDLALIYEALKEIDCAIKYHQKYLALCELLSLENEKHSANKHLIRCYKVQSDQMCESGEYEKAMAVLEKCVVFGQNAHDLDGEGIAHKTLANICFDKLSKYQKATVHYKKYLKICLEIGDANGEGFGYLKLGQTYQRIGDTVLATKYYESYLRVAGQHKNLESESEAAAALGDIYLLGNDHQNATKYYLQNFDISQQLNRKDDVNAARIKLGIARSKLTMSGFTNALNAAHKNEKSLNQIIEWKNKRTEIL